MFIFSMASCLYINGGSTIGCVCILPILYIPCRHNANYDSTKEEKQEDFEKVLNLPFIKGFSDKVRSLRPTERRGQGGLQERADS